MSYTFQNTTPTPNLAMTPDPENSTIFYTAGEEVLRVSRDGFWVKGVRVPADDREAESVYNAFKQWLAWQSLTR